MLMGRLGWGLVTAMWLAVGCAKPTPAEVVAPEPARPTGYPQPYHLLPLFTLNNTRLTQTADLLARTGNRAEKAEAGHRLIQLAETIATAAWRESQRPIVQRMNAQSGLDRNHENRWLDEWQKRHMARIYHAMAALGGEVVLDHCRQVAGDSGRRRGQQQLALGVLSAHELVKAGRTKSAWGMPPTPALAPPAPPPPSTFGATVGGDVPARARPAVEAPRVEGGSILNVNEVVDTLRPYFLVCYRRALAVHGRFGAWITLHARVAGDGKVAAVYSKGDESLPRGMLQCLQRVVQQARFAPPKGDPTVTIPLSFVAAENWQAGGPPRQLPPAPTAPVRPTPAAGG